MCRALAVLLHFVFLVLPVALAAETRAAFIVGNSSYENAPSLSNPVRDARLVGDTLSSLGFDVARHEDLTRAQFSEALADFLVANRDADVTFFYFAGHGMQYDGKNFLVGTDAQLRSELDIESETVALYKVVELLERNSKAALVFVDACRDNPLATDFYRRNFSETRALNTRGLARMRSRIDGSMLVFAAGPGQVAYDGDGRNSPFAEALAKHLPTENTEILSLTKRIIGDVRDATEGRQSPIVTNDLTKEIFLREAALKPDTAHIPETLSAKIAAGFAVADDKNTEEGWTTFLEKFDHYNNNPLVGLAVQKLKLLSEQRPDPIRPSGIARDAASIESELELYAAAERLASPRAWAQFFDRFPVGRLASSALEREERVFISDLTAKEFGRYRNAIDGEKLTPAMIALAIDTMGLSREKISEIQWALKSRGNEVGNIDGSIGPKTRLALSAFQRARDIPVTGLPTRATLSALGLHETAAPLADYYPTSGALSKVIDIEAAALLENDTRLDRLLRAFRGRPIIYGFYEEHLYAAVYLGTTYGEGSLQEVLTKAGAQLVEIGNQEEQDFILDLVRFDQKLWGSKGERINRQDGPTIGLSFGASSWQWRSGSPLGYTNWAPGEPKRVTEQSDLSRAYGRLVPVGAILRNATKIANTGWGTDMQVSPTIILEIE